MPSTIRRAVLVVLAVGAVALAGAPAAVADDAPPASDRITGATFAVSLDARGTAHVEATLPVTYGTASTSPHLWWQLPLYRSLDSRSSGTDLSAVQTVSGAHATVDVDGVRHDADPSVDLVGSSIFLDMDVADPVDAPADGSPDAPVGAATFHLSYDVAGAVVDDGSGPRLDLPLVDRSPSTTITSADVTVTGPRGPVEPTCAVGEPASWTADGHVACSAHGDGVRATFDDEGLSVQGAVPGVTAPAPVVAATYGDTIDRFSAAYVVRPDGDVDVTETIVYRFGDTSGRHGIVRSLVSREPRTTWRDRTYDIDVLGVSSPSGANADVTTATTGRERLRTLDVRVGSADETVRAPTATYVVHYRVRGALLRHGDTDELSWDAVGTMADTYHTAVDVTVQAPGAVTGARCWAGEPGTTTPCDDASSSGDTATFHASGLTGGDALTIDVTMPSLGAAAHVGPDLTPRALPWGLVVYVRLLGGLGLVTLVASVLVALVVRLVRHDRRSAGPGARVPRAVPPDVPLPVAGVLQDGALSTRETAGVLAALAGAGAISFEPNKGDGFRLRVHAGARGRDPFERVVLHALGKHAGKFPTTGDEKKIARTLAEWSADVPARGRAMGGSGMQSAVAQAHLALRAAVRAWFAEQQTSPATALFRGRPRFRTADRVPWYVLLYALPVPGLFPIALVVRFVHGLRPTGRTARGRELADQVTAFARHLDGVAAGARRADGATDAPPVGVLEGARPVGVTVGAGYDGFGKGFGKDGFGTAGSASAASAASVVSAASAAPALPTEDELFGTLLPWAVGLGVDDGLRERLAPLVESGAVTVPSGVPWDPARRLLFTTWVATTVTRGTPSTSSGSSGGSSGGGYSGGGGFSGGGGGGGGTSSW